jgi:GntR family transcriptional repressor for pyruvate dehydrogenase complex
MASTGKPTEPDPPVRPARTTGAPQPLRTSKISHMVAMALVEDIVSQDLKPGDRLPAEAAMLERFKVGRASIREGLRLLETYGVISIRPGQNGGPTVASLAADDLGRTLSLFFRLTGATYRDLIDARLVIEPVMARIAAERQDPEQLGNLREVMEREAASTPDEYLPSAIEFHHTVSGASGNPVLDLIAQALRTIYLDQFTGGGLFPEEARPTVKRVHHEIGEAILEGDGDRAERLMGEHMADFARLTAERAPWFMDERIAWEA